LKHTLGSDVDVLPHFYIGYTGGPPTAAMLTTYAGTLWSQWTTDMMPQAGTWVTLTEVLLQDISTATGAQGAHTGSVAGTAAGAVLPAGTCANLNFTVARRYRGGKPKIFLPYGTDTNLATPQTWSPTWIQNLATQFTSVVAAFVGGAPSGFTGTEQLNVSYYESYFTHTNSKGHTIYSPLYRSPTAKTDPIVAVTGSPTVGSQRRRNHGGG
jgi:hypothetical protein